MAQSVSRPRARRQDAANRAFFRPGCAIVVLGLLMALAGSFWAIFTGSWAVAIAGGILSVAGIATELVAIYLLYGPAAFDHPEGEQPLERQQDRKVLRYEYHPGVALMWFGVFSVGTGLMGAIISNRFTWPAILIGGGVILLLAGGFLELDVIVYRLGLKNTGKRLPDEPKATQ